MKRAALVLPLLLSGTFSQAGDQPGTGTATSSAQPSSDQPIILEPMVVLGETKLAFGFGLKVTRIEGPRVVLEMLVDRVKAGSDADRKGLKPGSRIMAINGRDVAGYEATFVHGSELNRIFVDRPQGSSVTLQVLVPGKKKPQKITIVRRSLVYEPAKIGGLPD